ncbi:MAG TPA: GNAT family N-acetyltransferase, partial [Dongiaceae bacterium]|nr:GNAT family N-acetyltransferase [Dongiaceae bacterium]
MDPTIRDARREDLPSMTGILNQLIAATTAIWTLSPTTLEARTAWLEERRARGFPVLVAEEAGGPLLGFASFGDFRPWEGYAGTVEHSVYVDTPARRRGVGRALLASLIDRAEARGLHAMVGGIEASNNASLALHTALGFREVGRLPEVGRK